MKRSMKTMAAGLVAAAVAGAAWGQSLQLRDDFRQSVQGALLEEATAALAESAIPAGVPVAILPIAGDTDGWLAGQLKIALTAAGKNCVEGKEDPMWNEVIKEITWDEHKEPYLDPETLDRMDARRLQSAKILLSGAVRSLDRTPRYSYFEIELHATEIATKRHLWGAALAKRLYAPGITAVGRVSDLDPELRQAMLDGLRDKLSESLAKANLGSVGRVALLPLAADEQEYVGGLVRDAATRAGVQAVNADWMTLSEARLGLRDPGTPADAVLYGSVRDLSFEVKETSPATEKTSLRAEVQLCIDTRSGATPWSDTITVSDIHEDGRGVWATLCRLFPSLESTPKKAVLWPVGIVVGLAAVILLLRFMTRIR